MNRGSIGKSSAMGVSAAVLLLFALANVALAQVPAGERAALLDLYTSTNGAAWTNSATAWREWPMMYGALALQRDSWWRLLTAGI